MLTSVNIATQYTDIFDQPFHSFSVFRISKILAISYSLPLEVTLKVTGP